MKKQDNRTSLEKSHSKASNAKLTLMCFFAALAVSAMWVGLALFKTSVPGMIKYLILGFGALLTILSLMLINKFTR